MFRGHGASLFFILTVICVLPFISLTGCSMMGGDDNSSGASNTPADVDTITMRNGDVLTGTLDFDSISIKTSYLPEMSIARKDINSIEFTAGSEAVKLRTKGGDILRGTISVSTFALTDSTLPEHPVIQRDDIRIIHCR